MKNYFIIVNWSACYPFSCQVEGLEEMHPDALWIQGFWTALRICMALAEAEAVVAHHPQWDLGENYQMYSLLHNVQINIIVSFNVNDPTYLDYICSKNSYLIFVLKGVVVCHLVEHHVEEPQEEVQGVELQREEPLQEEVVLHPKHQPEEAQPLAQDHQPRLRDDTSNRALPPTAPIQTWNLRRIRKSMSPTPLLNISYPLPLGSLGPVFFIPD